MEALCELQRAVAGYSSCWQGRSVELWTAGRLLVRAQSDMTGGNGVVGSRGRVVMRHIDRRGGLVMGAY